MTKRGATRRGPNRPEMNAEARILATVDAIPKGEIRGYGEVAQEAGLPGRARLVGKILSKLEEGSELPWHRVVLSNRRVAQGPQRERQLALLAQEGFRPARPGPEGRLTRDSLSD